MTAVKRNYPDTNITYYTRDLDILRTYIFIDNYITITEKSF